MKLPKIKIEFSDIMKYKLKRMAIGVILIIMLVILLLVTKV